MSDDSDAEKALNKYAKRYLEERLKIQRNILKQGVLYEDD